MLAIVSLTCVGLSWGPASPPLEYITILAVFAIKPGSRGVPLRLRSIPKSVIIVCCIHDRHGKSRVRWCCNVAVISPVIGKIVAGYGVVETQKVFQFSALLARDSLAARKSVTRSAVLLKHFL